MFWRGANRLGRLKNAANIQIILKRWCVVVDAGLGRPVRAAQAMELGADALLINTAIAQKKSRRHGSCYEFGNSRASGLPCRTDSSQSLRQCQFNP